LASRCWQEALQLSNRARPRRTSSSEISE
jgi:hypothetical protein